MSNQIVASTFTFFVTLSDQQQELFTGGADFELSGSNYANRLANLQGVTSSSPAGSFGNSIGTTAAINTASQDFLGLGASTVPTISNLGTAPILDSPEATPVTGIGNLGGLGSVRRSCR